MTDSDNQDQHDQAHAEYIADDGHCTKCRYDSAFAALDEAVARLTRLSDCEGMAVDAVLIVGLQHVEDDGSRTGHVEVYPRSGAQPSYVTRGLIDEGSKLLDTIFANAFNDDDDAGER